MPQDDDRAKWRRTGRFVVYGMVAVVGLLVVALLTGLPQRAVAEYVLSQQLGGTVSIEGLRTWGSVRADRVQLAGSGADGKLLPPVAIVQGIRIDYRLVAGRYLGEVVAESVNINLDARSGVPSNFAFLTERAEDPDAAAIDPRWLPERLAIEQLNVTGAINASRVTVRDLTLECSFGESGSASFELSGRDVGAAFAGLVEGLEPATFGGNVVVTAQLEGDAASVQANALLERAGDLNASAQVALTGPWLEPGAELRAFDATLHSASLDGRALGDFVAGLTDGGVEFDALIADPSHVRVDFAEESGLPEIHGSFLVQGLRLLAGEQPFYEGDLTVGADVPGAEATKGTVRLALDERHVIAANVEGSRTAGTMVIAGENWQKEKLIALLPPITHSFVRGLEFAQADLAAHVNWSPEGTESQGRVTAAGADEPIAVYSARLPQDELWNGEASLRIGEGTARVTYAGRALENFDLTSTLEDVPLDAAILLVAGDSTAMDIGGVVTATLAAQAQPDSEFIAYEGEASITGVAIGPLTFDSLAGELQGRLARTGDRAELSHVTLEAPDGVTKFGLTEVVWDLTLMSTQAQLFVALDLAHAARWYEMPDLFGEVQTTGKVWYSDGTLQLPLTIQSTTLGYGDIVLPYRTLLKAELTAEYNMSRDEGKLEGLKMNIGDGTLFVLSGGTFGLDPMRIGSYSDLVSDLQLAAGMGFFTAVQGRGRVSGPIHYDDQLLRAEWQADLAMDSVVFPDEVAAAQGLALAATIAYDEVMDGTGSLTAERVTIGGGHLTGLQGDIAIRDNIATIPDLRGEVFDGRFAGRVIAQLLEPGLPAEVSGRLLQFDLARFTEEVKPPETRLTGIADATFSVRKTPEGMEDLSVYATSTEGFSLNRDMVRQILESEALRGALGIAQIEKTVNKFLGEAPQRPFDSAELRLSDEGERLRGTAVLLSEKTEHYNGLNLTIELAIDQEALWQTLQMLEESEIANVHF